MRTARGSLFAFKVSLDVARGSVACAARLDSTRLCVDSQEMQATKQILDTTALRAVLARFPDIDAAYLFGSHADGRARLDSDIDIALLGDALERIRIELLAALAAAHVERVDVVIFERASLLLRFEALRRNRLLYRRATDVDIGTVFSRTMREYWDFRPRLLARAAIYREKVIHGAA
jgi:predicted nucleotidyltransferase